jgi:hypothetical protein
MADHARLSKERLKLIHSFMGESAVEHEEQPDPPDPLDLPPPVQPVDSGHLSAGPRPSAPSPARSSPARGRRSHGARVRSRRKPSPTGLSPFVRHHFSSRWPAAAVFLGVIVGVLIARAG